MTMSAKKLRRPLAVLLVLALSLGLVTHSVPGGTSAAKAADMTAGTSMDMPMDMPMTGDCSGCAGDEKGLMSTACFVFCGGVIGSSPLPVRLEAKRLATLLPREAVIGAGYIGPPDPYPPKPIVLS
ncbi:MAG TPA: hypothetical protein VFK79_17355 [Xanthobacteraceae bacterium]|nr:hypothetical protein [Xanthobacteraceae bacterium]